MLKVEDVVEMLALPLLGVIPVQRGTGTLTLASLPAGSHTFRLSLRRTDTVEPKTVYRTVRIP